MSERSAIDRDNEEAPAPGEKVAALQSSGEVTGHIGQGAAHGTPLVSHGDLDNDGDMDLTVRYHGKDHVQWFENTIGSKADAIYSHTMFRTLIPTAASAADVDGDGRTDLVVGHMSGVTIFLNDTFWTVKSLPISLSFPRAILLEDIDNDGDTDILVRDSRELLMVKNSPDGLGSEFLSWPDLGDSAQLSVGNFDTTNNHMEILTLNKEGLLGMIAHDGHHWQPLQQISSLPSKAINVTDINLDGQEDIVILDESDRYIWLENKGDGSLELHVDDKLTALPPSFPSEPDAVPGAPASVRIPQPVTVHSGPAPLSSPSAPDSLMASPEKAVGVEGIEELMGFSTGPDVSLYTAMQNFGPDSDVMHGWDRMDFMHAGDGNDYLHGYGGCDLLFGGAGDDTIIGGKQGDILFGGSGNDLVVGQDGPDYLFGGSGDDQLFGGADGDTITGDSGDDTLYGGGGSDVLFGGMGSDTMTGSQGQDTFYYTAADEGGDTIREFTVGDDRFEFEFGSDVLHIVTGRYSGEHESGGEAFIWEQTGKDSGLLYYDADTGSTGNERLIAEVHLDASGSLSPDAIDIC